MLAELFVWRMLGICTDTTQRRDCGNSGTRDGRGGPGTGASSSRFAGLASGVLDAPRIASNQCPPDCLPLQVILNCCEGGTPKETIEKLLHRVSEDKTLTAESLVKLLQAVKPTSPNLGLLLENLQKLATSPSTTGIS